MITPNVRKNTAKSIKYLIYLGVIALLFIILFIKLSFWQFARSQEKTEILSKIQNNNYKLAAQNISQINNAPEHSKITIKGHWDNNNSIFLSNQFYQHHVGYHVITPFIVESNQAILVNRGWINNIKPLKDNKIKNKITISGIVRNSNQKQYILGENILDTSPYTIIQKIDLNNLSNLPKMLNYNLATKYLNLITAEDTDNHFILDWHWTNMSPEKHFAYAIQWILLAITVILLYSCLCYSVLTKLKNKLMN